MSSEDDTYSSIFTALKHPIRRKMLRILDQAPSSYTEIQKQLEIDNGLLNYHLENMRDLINKGEDCRYSLSEFGRAALGVTTKVEEPSARKKDGVNSRLFLGIILILVVATASLSGFNFILFNNYQSQSTELSKTKTELDSAVLKLDSLTPLGELANISKPASWTTSGIQIVSGFPMSYTYQNLTQYTALNDWTNSIITFYVPVDGATVHLELLVEPVNVYELELTLQKGDAWKNDTRVNAGTKASYFNYTDPQNPTLNDIVWQSPILWSSKTKGNGVYESLTLERGWYTFSLFGPITAYGPNSVTGNGHAYIRAPSFSPYDPTHSATMLMSYKVFADFSIRASGKAIFFDVSSDRS